MCGFVTEADELLAIIILISILKALRIERLQLDVTVYKGFFAFLIGR
jgi:hypothetical protein